MLSLLLHLLHLFRPNRTKITRNIFEVVCSQNVVHRVLHLHDVCDRVERPHHLHSFLLLLQDHHEHGQLLGFIAIAQTDVHGHVHGRIPITRVNRHVLVPQAHHARRVLELDDRFQQTLEQTLHARFRKDPGDEFNALLCALRHQVHCGLRRGLQDVRVHAA